MIPQIVAYASCFRCPLFSISSLNRLLVSSVFTRLRSGNELMAGTDPLCSYAASCQGLPLMRMACMHRSR